MRSKGFYFMTGLLGGALLLLATSVSWAQMKIGFIDPEAITTGYKPFLDADKEVKRYQMELEREFTKQQNELVKMKETFKRQELLLSDKRKQEEQQSMLKKEQDLQRFLQEVSDPERGKLARKNAEVLMPIVAKVNKVVQEVAKENGYDFVFNTAALSYANEAYDLTGKVLEALEKDLEAEAKAAQGATQ